MKIQAIVLMGSVIPLVTPMVAQAGGMTQGYSGFYGLGDSLIDNGNLYNNITGQTFPPNTHAPSGQPLYDDGRFSNGPTFMELLSQRLGSTSSYNVNTAIGGSGSGDFHAEALLNGGQVGLRQQVSRVIGQSGGFVDPNALYVISSGTNDYVYEDELNPSRLPASEENVDNVIANIGEALTQLNNAGARNFLVLGIANYSNLPIASSDDFNSDVYNHLQDPNALSANRLTSTHNRELQTLLNTFSAAPNVKATYFDLDGFLDDLLANANSLGFTNTTEGCFDSDIVSENFNPIASLCSNPDEYLFFDRIHPTAKVHGLLADAVAEAVPQPVPEPLTILGAGTALGFGSMFKRKLAKTSKKS